jgi:UDP-N-acetylmuramate dehydrogenase
VPLELQQNIPLKKLTWMKVGGDADFYVEVRTKDELLEAFRFADEKKLPVIYLGQGSNMIVPDEGLRGVVVRLMNDQVEYDFDYSNDTALVKAEGGKILSKFIFEARKKGLNGLDNFVGIPGVVGAAVRGNIGIPTQEFGELVKSVEIFDGKEFRTLLPEDCHFIYRGSSIKDQYWLVWSVELLVVKGEPPKKDELLLQRIAKQPKGNSCGSFFKNPDPKNGLYAGKLIEECGLKGKKKGGALISEMHGNFLMNDGTGTAQEVVELAREVKNEVFAKKGILLENEVLIYDPQGKLIEL